MARPLRIEYQGAWYHVMNRGLAHQKIFHNEKHYGLFFDLLRDIHEKFQIEVHAYCLMNNHYHLLIRTPFPNLGRAMRHIDGVYTQKFNYFTERDGPLFRGRYKAILVDANSYLLQLSRYIHLNPVSAGIHKKPEEYPWSSYRFYLVEKDKPQWLSCKEILDQFGFDANKRIESYCKFVHEGVDTEIASYFGKSKAIPILGTDDFIERIRKKYIPSICNKNIPEISEVVKYTSPSAEKVIGAVAKYFLTTPTSILINKKRKSGNLARRLAIYMISRITNENHKSISRIFNGVSCSRVSLVCKEIELELTKNIQLSELIEKIKKEFR